MFYLRVFWFLILHQTVTATYLEWPEKYHFKAILNIPSANVSQPYEVWSNGVSGNRRFDFYEGMSKLYDQRNKKNASEPFRYIWVGPESDNVNQNKIVCRRLTNKSREVGLLNTYLPPTTYYLTEKGQDVDQTTKWEFQFTGSYGVVFKFAVWTTGSKTARIPVRYEYRLLHKGVELDFIQHIYEKFTAGKSDPEVFEIPHDIRCKSSLTENNDRNEDPSSYLVRPMLAHNTTEEFERFKSAHNKQYKTDDEHIMRFNVFQKNFRYIQSMNRQQGSYKLGINHLADRTEKELSLLLGTKIDPELIDLDLSSDFEDDDKTTDAFDWRWYNAVTPVKDQTTLCGGCYAFSTAAAVESASFISKGCIDMEEASEQALIDCSRGLGNNGCNFGILVSALRWVGRYGIPLRSDYGPYLAMEGFCNLNQSYFLHISGFEKISKSIKSIKRALRLHGPLAAAINVPKSLFYYISGVYDDKTCSSDQLTHAIVIVGYGSENGKRYWLIKNSYGAQWGEGGYFKLDMEKNLCGVTSLAYAVLYDNSLVDECNREKYI